MFMDTLITFNMENTNKVSNINRLKTGLVDNPVFLFYNNAVSNYKGDKLMKLFLMWLLTRRGGKKYETK